MSNTQSIPHKIYPLNQDINATWFVEFYFEGKRIKKYGRLSHVDTLKEKQEEAKKIIAAFTNEKNNIQPVKEEPKESSILHKIYPLDRDLTKVWFIEFYFNDKRIKKYGKLNQFDTVEKRLKEAEKIIAKFNKENNAKTIKKSETIDFVMKFEKALDNRALYLRPNSDKTYRTKTMAFLKWYRSNYRNREVKIDEIATEYIKHLKARGLSNTTLNAYRATLKTIFKDTDIKPNPFADIRKFREHRESYHYFDYEKQTELSVAIRERDPELWLACQFQYYLLLRPNELRLIQCGAFNLRKGTVTVPGEISKNGKTMSVIIPNDLISQIEFIQQSKPDHYVFGAYSTCELKAGIRPHTKKYFADKHQKLLKQLRYDVAKYKFYSWKHTGAVMYYQATGDVKGLKEQGRWHSLDMVNEYLKNLGVMDIQRISKSFPSIGSNLHVA